ncbi:esterase/lipase family protein [Alkalisalibacterium limincola]|uniref:Phospholipase n=1 Tax=Alkalisalibacterium limincola TaxID=2699169 RepID=A0A5C8KVE0_9GAMM|nr:phospholipase [Alkalisalibacterium limincola]TXK66014.1 phospholipase [Alkalisalibacterium limincola]
MSRALVIFVHGWSVTSTDTYGQLPARLRAESERRGGPALDIHHVYLGQYVSFRDEVRVADIARAFDAALAPVLAEAGGNRRFVCITHSTGGPVLREWVERFFVQPKRLDTCPMSHLVMLAPANFGSALAQLGKTRIASLKSWFQGIEPGQGVLDWLELGSSEANALNLRWIHDYPKLKLTRSANPLFQFVLTGDAIDRKLYDHVNSYTGEPGSDGVVRVSSANLNACHLVLRQPGTREGEALPSARKRLRSLEPVDDARAERTAFRIIPGTAHSGDAMGIMRSVANDDRPHPTVDAILRCLAVRDHATYQALCNEFDAENELHQTPQRRVEMERIPVLPDRAHITDPHAMVIFRLFDQEGARVDDVDLLLTAGPADDPNQLPSGFLRDRQGNRRSGAVCFQFNHAVLAGCEPILRPDGRVARGELIPRPPYGLRLDPRVQERFVETWQAAYTSDMGGLLQWIQPNQTTIIDIHLQRIVRSGVFRLTRSLAARDFRRDELGPAIAGKP